MKRTSLMTSIILMRTCGWSQFFMRPLAMLICTLLLVGILSPEIMAQGKSLTPDQAGEIARQQTGGRVLAVKPTDGGYQVKVLTPGGEVRYVFVPSR